MALEDAAALRMDDAEEYIRRSLYAMATHVRAMPRAQSQGAVTFDYGNNIRAQAKQAGVEDALKFQASCLSTSGHCSARVAARFVGLRCQVIPKTFARPTTWRWSCSGRSSAFALAEARK